MKILLLGKHGQVGWELQRALAPLGELVAVGRAEVDFEKLESIRACIQLHQPHWIVNAVAYTAVDKAESESEKAQLVNAEAVACLAQEAKKLDAWLIHYSTDYVFDGNHTAPYVEDDQTMPMSVYGKTKLMGEAAIQAQHAKHLIFRTSWVYSLHGANFVKTMLRLATERDTLNVVADQIGAPTSAELIADVSALVMQAVLQSKTPEVYAGVYHLAATGQASWYHYAQHVIAYAEKKGKKFKVAADKILPIATEDYPLPAKRPKNSRLNTHKISTSFNLNLPDWRMHVERMLDEMLDEERK